jgi:hypothetical protein
MKHTDKASCTYSVTTGFYSLFFILLSLFFSCSDEAGIPYATTTVILRHPANLLEIKADTFIFKNISTLMEWKFPANMESIQLPSGFYNCYYRAEVKYQNDDVVAEGILQGLKESISVTQNEMLHFTLDTYISAPQNDFIIEEIFFTGTLRSTGKQYYGDGYLKIYNNTDHVLYADGITLLESQFLSVKKYNYTPDIRMDTMTVQAVYVIPGNGMEHPVNPGESLTICDTGIDHRLANPNSFDLSHADFEWYDISNSPSNMDIDSETTPHLDKDYCYPTSFWILHNRGFKAYAIARMKEDKETYLKNYRYTYKYEIVLAAGTYPMQQTAYKVPNSWIVDAVNCSVAPERQWNILPPSLDAGWTHCGSMDADPNRYFKSVRRKMLYLVDGRRVLKDTNNSSEDFNTECIPSIIEEQHTAINANGTPATTLTYDGIQPK